MMVRNRGGGVMQGSDRNLYGSLAAGGPSGRGVLFQLTLAGKFTTLHAFGGTDSRPGPGVVEVLQNDPVEKGQRSYFLYGAASWNASIATPFNSGILYRMREQPYTEPANKGKEFSNVYNVEATNGANPSTTPILGRDSNLYGTMAGGGAHTQGVLYRLNTKYEVTGDPGTFKIPGDAPGASHQKFVIMGDPGGKSVIYDDRSSVQVITRVAGFQPAASDATKAKTSDGISVRVKDLPPFSFWPRENALTDRAQLVQFFYRERLDSKNHYIQGVAENWNPQHTYTANQTARYNGFLWFSQTNGNIDNPPPADESCLSSASGCTDKFWVPAYWYTDPVTHVKNLGSCTASEMKPDKCTIEPQCPPIADRVYDTNDLNAVGYECVPLTTNPSSPAWIVDAQGRATDPTMSSKLDPYYLAVDTQIDCDGVTIFDSPTLTRNGPLPLPAGASMPNADETQTFAAWDFVIVDRKVVAWVKWTLQELPSKDEDYGVPSVTGPPLAGEQACFADLLAHYNFESAFDVPGNVKCAHPLY